MKKITNTYFILAAFLVLLVGCSSPSSSPVADEQSPNSNKIYTPRLIIVPPSQSLLYLTSGDAQSGAVSTVLAQPLVVTAKTNGTPAAGVSVTFAITSIPAGASGQSLSTTTITTDANGQASTLLTFGNIVGVYSVTATSGNSSVTFNDTATVSIKNPTITIAASRTFIWPPNKKMVPVTFSGVTTDAGTNSITYTLVDEYGKLNTTGTLAATSNYSFTLLLQASRKGNDKNGRTYTLTVNLGTASATAVVTVPHDMGNDHEGDDDDGDDDDHHDGEKDGH